ncbi:TPA: tRNA isopentenyl-2-thiomethyl-A-37 hydroxylase MiaE [Photobacterium damselae]
MTLAEKIAGKDISDRILVIGAREAEMIMSPDHEFRFHSGIPI